MASYVLLAVVALLTAAFLVYRSSAASPSKASGLPLPPGPKPRFLLGNTADLPIAGTKEWEHWSQHKHFYGPISALSVLGQTIIVLNGHQVAVDLLDKKSAIYSSRPKMVFGGDMCGWEHSLILQPYGESFRAYRKATHSALGTMSAVENFKPFFDTEIRRFLLRVLRKPEDLQAHIRTTAGAIILGMLYGYQIDPQGHDPLLGLINKIMHDFVEVCQPGKYAVDMVPALRYLPDWFPGTGFKRHAKRCKATLEQTARTAHAFVEKQLRNGSARPSYLSRLISDDKLSANDAHVARWTAFSLYSGGADTTVSSMSTFFLTMTLHPEIQRVAQKELDSVLGDVRLPTFTDRPNLPYIEALVKEVLRFHPVAPMSFVHVSTQADVYEGYSIPKGSLVFPNAWAMLHDPSVYSSPDTFNPERFLGDAPEPDPTPICFGFGRRVCPGKLVADLSLWLEVANSLYVFDVRKARDANGEEIIPEMDFASGVVSHPKDYKCDVVPRSARHAELIESIEIEQPWSSHGDSLELKDLIPETAVH